MPQIWLDDEELGAFLESSPAHARTHAVKNGWARMKSRTGTTRTRLPQGLTQEYLLSLTQKAETESAASASWLPLRKSLLALIPGRPESRPRPGGEASGQKQPPGHSIAPALLLSTADQSNAA